MQCDQSILWTLVNQDRDPGDEADRIARHLESCSACRDTLADLGGSAADWREACQWLDPSAIELVDDDHDVPPLPPVDLSFLEAPAHPEMLGRIGRYDVEGLLGRGGMGVVLRAYDRDLQRTVAVKVMAPEWAASEPARRRFAREAQAAASVAHDNVIPIYNVESSATLPYLVMRYVPGMTLEKWVLTNGCPDPPTILRVAGQLVEGLAAAHRRGLVHRDIKPGNVLVGHNIERVWITDFGLARAADSLTLTRTGVIAGTPHYMSPEQARGETVDHRSDLFSLGCVFFFLAAGRPPFDAENTLAVLHKLVSQRAESLTAIRKDLPPSFVDLVDRLLQRSPDRRPADCQSVLKWIADAQAETGRGRVATAPPLRLRIPKLAAALAAAVLLAVIGYACWPQPQARPHGLNASSDPWLSADAESEIDPYVNAVSDRIESQAVFAQQRYQAELTEIDRGLKRLERSPPQAISPSITLGTAAWNQEVGQLDRRLKTLEQR